MAMQLLKKILQKYDKTNEAAYLLDVNNQLPEKNFPWALRPSLSSVTHGR
ncbi:MAG: hypothetical protein K2W94_05935 [Alphaproteobacteria bacterium]|nr:hypothetical protein [Alphaproteobacteria bacterium]